jgi:hypothetical protein
MTENSRDCASSYSPSSLHLASTYNSSMMM